MRVDVRTGSNVSSIWIGDGMVDRLAPLLDEHRVGARRFVVSSPVIWRLHGPQIQHALGGGEPILIPDGERYKNLQSVSRIYDPLIQANADRGSAVIAVGGGVIGDTAGFAAATYLRGITLVHVPTTLLAQVDSSIGGKVGVNHALGKNLIGAFHQPALVAIDPLLLATLPRREFRSGLYEVVKYGMIASRDLFDRVARDTKAIFARDPDVLGRGHRRVVPHQGRRRLEGRARKRAAPHPQLRPHRRPRARGGHEVPPLPSRRSDRLRDARGGRPRRRTRRARRPRTRRRSRRSSPSSVRCRPSQTCRITEIMEAIRRDKKVVHGRLHFVIAD